MRLPARSCRPAARCSFGTRRGASTAPQSRAHWTRLSDPARHDDARLDARVATATRLGGAGEPDEQRLMARPVDRIPA